MKRFYKLVSVEHSAAGYVILLDGKPVKTPARADLIAPSKSLAEAIMAEWAAQEEMIDPESMPLMQILSTKIDRVRAERDAMTEQVMKYLNGDLLCYRADHPPELVKLQKESWNLWLDWFEKEFGHRLETTEALSALTHPEEVHSAVLNRIKSMNEDEFTVLQLLVPLSGSMVLGLAFVNRAITANDLFAAARVEESYKAMLYNEEKYGPDPAQEEKDLAVKRDLKAAEQYLKFL